MSSFKPFLCDAPNLAAFYPAQSSLLLAWLLGHLKSLCLLLYNVASAPLSKARTKLQSRWQVPEARAVPSPATNRASISGYLRLLYKCKHQLWAQSSTAVELPVRTLLSQGDSGMWGKSRICETMQMVGFPCTLLVAILKWKAKGDRKQYFYKGKFLTHLLCTRHYA